MTCVFLLEDPGLVILYNVHQHDFVQYFHKFRPRLYTLARIAQKWCCVLLITVLHVDQSYQKWVHHASPLCK